MKYFCLFAGILSWPFPARPPRWPVQVGAARIHQQGGYKYRLKPGQAMIVSVIKLRQTWHVIPIKGEDYWPALARILDPEIRPVSVRADMRFLLGKGMAGGLAVSVKSGPL